MCIWEGGERGRRGLHLDGLALADHVIEKGVAGAVVGGEHKVVLPRALAAHLGPAVQQGIARFRVSPSPGA